MAAIALEQTDLMADRRRRNTELVCGLLEAHVPRRGLEGAQLDKGWKLSHAARVDEIHSSAHEIFAFAFATAEMEKNLQHSQRSRRHGIRRIRCRSCC